jgi:site-specific DNA-methyltransferase (adenine-specific)
MTTHTINRVTIYEGDCLQSLRAMPDESVHCVVTDPPYGLSFMGKRWDYDVPAVEVWQECLRVLKPGGHLLAFAGTRTQHRMAVRIEDAGFEIRDMIAWCYGSGFPKSLDVSKAIDKAAGAEREVLLEKPAYGIGGNGCYGGHAEGATATITAPATEAAKQWEGWGTALKPSWESVTWARKPLPAEEERRTIIASLSQLESRLWLLQHVNAVKSNLPSSQSEFAEALNTAQWTVDDCINTQAGLCDQMGMLLFELAATISLNTVSSWNRILGDVWNQASTSTIETASSMTTDWKILRYCLSQITVENMLRANSLPGGFSVNACNAGRTFSALLASLEATLTLSAIGPAMSQAAESYPGKDVRPSLEPVMVARKPLCGTVAENVLHYGTGGLNVDGCRIAGDMGPDRADGKPRRTDNTKYGKANGRINPQSPLGRWPANLIHDGSDEVVGLFPETTSGDLTAGKTQGKGKMFETCGGNPLFRDYPGDTGSAARYFYCAKADASERRNSKHPTVKPLALMRYLCRLVCPPDGIVLDPFCGSGTTLEAARLEGFQAIGCELNPEYIADCKERLKQGVLF